MTHEHTLSETLKSELLRPIAGKDPCGVSLRYTSIYDQVQEAQRGEDARLFQGVWEQETKSPDWLLTENLCIQVLREQSKDLQFAAWLAEAWVGQHFLWGVSYAFDFLGAFCQTFWAGMYPKKVDADFEYRQQILEWLDQALGRLLVTMPFAKNPITGDTLTLNDWQQAFHLDKVSKRVPHRERFLTALERGGGMTLGQFHETFSLMSETDVQRQYTHCLKALDRVKICAGYLDALEKNNLPSFNAVRDTLQQLQRLLDQRLKSPAPITLEDSKSDIPGEPVLTSEEPSLGDVATGDHTLQSIEKAYHFLQQAHDLLRPVPAYHPQAIMISKVLLWREKSLIDIFKTVSDEAGDWGVLAKFFE